LGNCLQVAPLKDHDVNVVVVRFIDVYNEVFVGLDKQ